MTTDNAQISIRKAQLAFQLIWAKIPRQTNKPLFVLCCWPCCFRCFTSLNLLNFDASPYLHVRVFLTFLSFDVLLGSNLPNVCSIHFHFLDLINSTMGCWLVQFQSFYDQRMPMIFLIHRLTRFGTCFLKLSFLSMWLIHIEAQPWHCIVFVFFVLVLGIRLLQTG
mgnify:CR=1 FL=1